MPKDFIDFNQKTGFICDMDGVIYHGNRILPGVADFIQWLHEENKEYLFLTNNSGYTPRELQQKLARMGLDVPEEHFYTSALATAAFLKDQAPGCSVFAIGEAGLLNALYDAGLTMNDVNPDYVVVGEGRTYSLDTLTKAVNLVMAGANPGAFIDNVVLSHDGYESELEDEAIIGFDIPIDLPKAEVQEEVVEHAEDEDETVADVLGTLNEKQKDVVAFLIKEALSHDNDDDNDSDDADDDDDVDDDDDGGH